MKGLSAMLLGTGLLLTVLMAAQAGEVPPKDGKPLSELIKSVEDQKAGVITEVEFDDGLWEVEVHKGSTKTEFCLDPKSGKVIRQQNSTDRREALPPKDGKPLSAIVKSLEGQKVGVITEVEFDDGYWEVTVRRDGQKIKMDIDPMSGKRHAQ